MIVSNPQQRLIELMNEFDITQEELARRTGIPKSSIHNYVKGGRAPRQDKISVIAETFNLDPAWILGFDVPMIKGRNAEMGRLHADIIRTFMKLNPGSQRAVLNLMENLLEEQKKHHE